MQMNIEVINEIAEEATSIYCAATGCDCCEYQFYETCSSKLKATLVKTLITELAIEIVKEKANESED